eukprot:scaffold4707_cov164-Amphora_coffeaeformis.AAC.22
MNGGDMSPQTTIFHTDHSLAELPRSITRPSRESVLQRLSESLLRRSLTKVCTHKRGRGVFLETE